MAETLEIKSPQILKITNTSTKPMKFKAYRENFVTTLAAGKAVEFEAKTAGQALYYLKQKTEGLTVAQESAYAGGEGVLKIEVPAKITIENKGSKTQLFRPYKENFDVEVKAGDKVILTVDYFGQVLYYLAQATGTTLTITQEKVSAGA